MIMKWSNQDPHLDYQNHQDLQDLQDLQDRERKARYLNIPDEFLRHFEVTSPWVLLQTVTSVKEQIYTSQSSS